MLEKYINFKGCVFTIDVNWYVSQLEECKGTKICKGRLYTYISLIIVELQSRYTIPILTKQCKYKTPTRSMLGTN